MSRRAASLSLGGAVLAAIAASSCCVLPLVFAVLGASGAGAVAAFGAYRPYILGATASLLAAGFYLSYRKPKADVCGCEARTPKASRVGLWIATGLVAVFVLAPYAVARVARHDVASTASRAPVEHAVIRVVGMDCEACGVTIEKTLTKVGGFHDLTLDLEHKTVTVAYEPARGRLQAYVAAINDVGYEASLL